MVDFVEMVLTFVSSYLFSLTGLSLESTALLSILLAFICYSVLVYKKGNFLKNFFSSSLFALALGVLSLLSISTFSTGLSTFDFLFANSPQGFISKDTSLILTITFVTIIVIFFFWFKFYAEFVKFPPRTTKKLIWRKVVDSIQKFGFILAMFLFGFFLFSFLFRPIDSNYYILLSIKFLTGVAAFTFCIFITEFFYELIFGNMAIRDNLAATLKFLDTKKAFILFILLPLVGAFLFFLLILFSTPQVIVSPQVYLFELNGNADFSSSNSLLIYTIKERHSDNVMIRFSLVRQKFFYFDANQKYPELTTYYQSNEGSNGPLTCSKFEIDKKNILESAQNVSHLSYAKATSTLPNINMVKVAATSYSLENTKDSCFIHAPINIDLNFNKLFWGLDSLFFRDLNFVNEFYVEQSVNPIFHSDNPPNKLLPIINYAYIPKSCDINISYVPRSDKETFLRFNISGAKDANFVGCVSSQQGSSCDVKQQKDIDNTLVNLNVPGFPFQAGSFLLDFNC
ncbi:MAG: hypothetical protein WC821_01120 [archaeon]|jgi:hypothetical protein